MTMWVVRKSLEGHTIGEPCRCARPERIAREPGVLTLEEAFAILLNDGESVEKHSDQPSWIIFREKSPVGSVQVIDGLQAELLHADGGSPPRSRA
jgi:hypothetical protein